MSDEKAVPYIKRLENHRDVLIAALKAVDVYHAAVDRANTTAFKYDALKTADIAKRNMMKSIGEAKSQLGGLYA